MSLLQELVSLHERKFMASRDRDHDNDNDFADVQMARMEKSGMPKNKAFSKSRKHNNVGRVVGENDITMNGGTRQQPGPDTTDGPYNPEMNTYGDDTDDAYGDYQDFGDMEGMDDDNLEGEDIVGMDVPLVIRMMEWAREEAPDDIALHKAVDNMLDLTMERETGDLTMDDYEAIIEGCCDSEEDMDMEMGSDDEDADDEFDFDTGAGDDMGSIEEPGMEDECATMNPRVSRY